MSPRLCPSTRKSKLIRVSLVSATAKDSTIDHCRVARIAKVVSEHFGFRTDIETHSTGSSLVWAFIHRYGERPYSEELPKKKAVSIFLRNGSDPCIPCTFLCPGCREGSVRVTVSGLSPYGIDSEVLTKGAVKCMESALSTHLEIEYGKKGLMWDGYVPAAVRRFSGSMFNMSLLDYFHRFSGVLSDFEYPMSESLGH